jgi:hypothetical protein
MSGPLHYGPGIKAYVLNLLIAQMLARACWCRLTQPVRTVAKKWTRLALPMVGQPTYATLCRQPFAARSDSWTLHGCPVPDRFLGQDIGTL